MSHALTSTPLAGTTALQNMGERKIAQGQADKADKLKPIAEELGCSLAQLALAWCVRNKNVSTVITGSTKVHQVSVGPLLWQGCRC